MHKFPLKVLSSESYILIPIRPSSSSSSKEVLPSKILSISLSTVKTKKSVGSLISPCTLKLKINVSVYPCSVE